MKHPAAENLNDNSFLRYKDVTATLFQKVYKHPGTHQLQDFELLFRVQH